jgi:hypothetical protein
LIPFGVRDGSTFLLFFLDRRPGLVKRVKPPFRTQDSEHEVSEEEFTRLEAAASKIGADSKRVVSEALLAGVNGQNEKSVAALSAASGRYLDQSSVPRASRPAAHPYSPGFNHGKGISEAQTQLRYRLDHGRGLGTARAVWEPY